MPNPNCLGASASGGKLSLDPSASAKFFCIAAPGLPGTSGFVGEFLILYIVSNLVLFGGVYWSKFAHMFYKPGAAIQKNLAEADGSRDNLPPEADAPEQFGKGIKREEPKHY